ncbi:MAG: tyrosine-type recombinase/integrase, partial [Gaiella sp.]
IEGRIRLHDLRHAALTNLAATDASPIAVMATAGHRSMQTTKPYLHLAGTTFAADAAALEARLLGERDPGPTIVEPDDDDPRSTPFSTRLGEPQPIEDDATSHHSTVSASGDRA